MEKYTEPLRSIEGVFTGENMVDEDGKNHHIPPNYISKSKLVEGDWLKLNIFEDGSFIYKQTKPVPRKRVVGVITEDMTVKVEGKDYRICIASLSFYRARPGNDAVVLLPVEGDASYAALENIIDPYRE